MFPEIEKIKFLSQLEAFSRNLETHLLPIVWKTGAIASVPLLTIVVLLFILLSCPIYIYRWLVMKFARRYVASLGEIINPQGSIFAVDPIYSKPNDNICVTLHFEKPIDLESIQACTQENVMEARLPSGELQYPEFRQFLTKFCGFHFWEWDPSFDIKDHIKTLPRRVAERIAKDESNFEDLEKKLIDTPWKVEKPLWEFLLANFPDSGNRRGSVLFVRMHHTMGDGYSIFKLLSERLGGVPQSELKLAEPKYATRSRLEKAIFTLLLPIKSLTLMSEMMVYPFLPGVSLPFITSSGGKREIALHQTTPIAATKFNDIKNGFGVRYTSVIFSVVSGAIREFITETKKEVSPPLLVAALPLPLPNHTDRMRNEFTGTVAYFPTGKSDAINRLRHCDKEFNRLKHSAAPITTHFIFNLIGAHLSYLIEPIMTTSTGYNSITLSIFPAGNTPLDLMGNKCTGVNYGVGLWKERTGIAFHFITYQDQMRVTITGDQEVVNKKELKQLGHYLEAELDILHKAASSNTAKLLKNRE